MDKKPNVIYILADDMGYGDISALNENCGFQTPNFDRMAAEGEAFTDAHASSAVCTPSRYSIMTGRYNWRSRLKWGVISSYGRPMIEKDRMTVAQMLKGAGYYTAIIGKWHLGMDFKKTDAFAPGINFEHCDFENQEGIDFSGKIENTPTSYGFDYYYGIAASLDMPPFAFIENDHFTEMPDHQTVGYGKQFWRAGPTAPHFVHEEVLPHFTDKVIEQIETCAKTPDQPFFIYFPMPAPHTPILPTEEFRGKSGTNEYGDFVLECDAMVGRIMDKVQELGLDKDTIIIYTSDNGCSPRADYQQLLAKGHNPSYVFRGHKYHIFEGGHRIPLLVRWPGNIKPGTVCHQIVCLSDLMATLAELLGIQLPDSAGVDSVSNLPIWMDPEAPEVRESIVHQGWDGTLSIRRGDYKLEMCLEGSGGDRNHPGPRDTYLSPNGKLPAIERAEAPTPKVRYQLYNLRTDIGEYVNIIDEHPDIAEALKRELVACVRNGRTTAGPAQENTGDPIWEAIQWIADEP